MEFFCPVADDVHGIHPRQWQLNQKSRPPNGSFPAHNRAVQLGAVSVGISDLFPDGMAVFQGSSGVVVVKFFPDSSVANSLYFRTIFYNFNGDRFLPRHTAFYGDFFDACFLVDSDYL